MGNSSNNNNDWTIWSKHVLKELERIDTRCQNIENKIDKVSREDIQKIWIEITALKVKAGIWGLLGGIIPIALTLLIKSLT